MRGAAKIADDLQALDVNDKEFFVIVHVSTMRWHWGYAFPLIAIIQENNR